MSNDVINTEALERPRQHRENRKKNIGRKVEDNQAHAVAKFLRVPPRKARLVIDEIRGKYASEALAFLRYIPNRAAQYISKVLTSAVANGANNHDLNPENLKVVECKVDEGPRMKRMQQRAQGRGYRILKRMCHITIIVEETTPKPRKPRKVTRLTQTARTRFVSTPLTEPEVETTEETVEPETIVETLEGTPLPEAEATTETTTETTETTATSDEHGAPTA